MKKRLAPDNRVSPPHRPPGAIPAPFTCRSVPTRACATRATHAASPGPAGPDSTAPALHAPCRPRRLALQHRGGPARRRSRTRDTGPGAARPDRVRCARPDLPPVRPARRTRPNPSRPRAPLLPSHRAACALRRSRPRRMPPVPRPFASTGRAARYRGSPLSPPRQPAQTRPESCGTARPASGRCPVPVQSLPGRKRKNPPRQTATG